jgi:hypothetical protein
MIIPAARRPAAVPLLVLAVLAAAGTVRAGTPAGEDAAPARIAAPSFRVGSTETVIELAPAAGDKSAGTAGCLVALPRNATAARARPAGGGEGRIVPGRLMIMRGRPVLPVRIEGAAGPVAVAVTHDGDWAAEGGPDRLASAAFDAMLGAAVPATALTASAGGSYVIVHPPAYAEAAAELADWKQRKGLAVRTVSTDVTGASTDGIKSWLQEAYDTWDLPPEYVLLMGDVDVVPTFSFEGNPSDLPYALVDGEDFVPDLMLGRFPVANAVEALTLARKSVMYERTPHTDDTAWFTRSLMVAGLTGSTTPPHTLEFCGEQLESMGFDPALAITSPVPYPPLIGATLIKQHIDSGVSMVVYRGWAYGSGGWDPPTYTVNDIPALANGAMMPVVMSFVCLTGDYTASEPCFGEVFVRQGTPEDPAHGAVAFVGNGEHWSHTRHNDAMAISVFERVTGQDVADLGTLLNAGKLRFFDYFPGELDAETNGELSVEFYVHIYNLMGDPELNHWRAAPRAVDVAAPSMVPAGAGSIEINVSESAGGAAVAGARVGVVQDGVLLGSARTDPAGRALVPLAGVLGGPAVEVTVTGASVLPVEIALPTTTLNVHVAAADLAPAGGADLQPGAAVGLDLTMTNFGFEAGGAFTVTAARVTGPAAVGGAASFGALDAGASATAGGLTIDVAADARDGDRILVELVADRDGALHDSALVLTVRGPTLDPAALGAVEGAVEPGAVTALSLLLHNSGSAATAGGSVNLDISGVDGVSLTGASAAFGACEAGAEVAADAGLEVSLAAGLAVGTNLVFTATVTTSEGAAWTAPCALVVGDVDVTAPVGPDAYGYYAYDSADLEYPAGRPRYEWTEISTAFGGEGARLDFSVPDNLARTVLVDLPFVFRYYGQDYDRIRVCDNGWISFDLDDDYDFYNWTLPSTHGNDALVAPWWDGLDPEIPDPGDENPNGIAPDGIYAWHDAAAGAFIVEWSRLPNYIPTVLGLQTFQVVLLDPAVHPSAGGDGQMLFQYRHVNNNDTERMFASVGWESPDGLDGLQLSYDNVNAAGMAPLQPGLAVRVTTDPPVRVPFTAVVTAADAGESLGLAWTPGDDRPVLGWHVDRVDDGGLRRLTTEPLPAAARAFTDPQPSADAGARYVLTALHPWGKSSRAGEIAAAAAMPTRVALRPAWPNPSRGSTTLGFALPRAGVVRLRVYDVAGRLVRTLVDGPAAGGESYVTWDGRDDAGGPAADGLYFCRLEAESGAVTRKFLLMR